jgi:ketosteroid isomerase-like protein
MSPLRALGATAAAAALGFASPVSAADDPALATQLQAKTQAMADAIAIGDKAVWGLATDPALIFVNENNEVETKAQLLEELTPLPAGLVGHIKVTDYRLQRHGDSAVATYIADESLDYHGQLIKTKFRTTDTWRRTPRGWTMVASMTLAALSDPPAIALPAAKLADYAGRYALTSDIHYTVRADGEHLYGVRDGGKEVELKAEAIDLFFVPGSPRSRKVFYRDSTGRVSGFGDRREGNDIVWRRV